MFLTSIALILSLMNLVMFTCPAVAPTHLLVTRVGPCLETPKFAVTISEMRIARKVYDFSVSGDLNISRDIENGWTVKAVMEKCQDIRNLDSCDYFRSYLIIKDGCIPDSPDEDVYNMFFHYSSPRLTCPLKSGAYKITSYPFFMEDNYLTVSESKISTSMFGYTFRLEGYNEKHSKILCASTYLQLLYIRKHNWDVEYVEEKTDVPHEELHPDADEEQ